jgi:hypothetical protein
VLYALVDGAKRGPLFKGERAVCACGSELIAVLPTHNVKHWRHPAGDCDRWSEPEGPWHLGWKEKFEIFEREVDLIEEGERHRADILVMGAKDKGTVVELQHSHISDEERARREGFYRRHHRMFWLLHLHNEQAFHLASFGASSITGRESHKGKVFTVMQWGGTSQFIEKWKHSNAHVFLDLDQEFLCYLATNAACRALVAKLKKGQFAVNMLMRSEFIDTVNKG